MSVDVLVLDNQVMMESIVKRTLQMFLSSTSVLIYKLDRVRNKRGSNNGSISD